MTTYRLFPSTNGPSAPIGAGTGAFLCGILFKVTQGGMFFNGYYHWVPTGGDTVARKFALWNVTGASTKTLISAATVTSGTLTANAWNFVPLSTAVPLAIGASYNACTGWTVVNGFPDSDTSGAGTGAADSFGTGGHTGGITQGPLFAFSDSLGSGGTKPEQYIGLQGVFSTAGTDPTVNMPAGGSNSGNFWMDVQVQDTTPSGYSGSYRLWPNKFDTNNVSGADSPVNYNIATEFALSQACSLNKIWYYSPAGTAQLATACGIWSITSPGTSGTKVAGSTSPTWSAAAASGWVSCSFTGVTLPAGKYKVAVFNGAAAPDGWSVKDSNSDYWRAGDGGSGITWGPLSAPGLSNASTAFNYNGSDAGSTPPFTDGTTLAGQSTFEQSTTEIYPALFAPVATPTAGSTQNYWVDVEVTPSPGQGVAPPQLAVTRTEVVGGGRGGMNRAIRM